jgi:hypothetical protein
MIAPSPPRPTAAAVTAALTPFLGLPLAIALMIATQSREEGGFDGLARAWVEGGSGMYLVLLASSVLGLVCGPLMYWGVSRGSGAMLAAAPLSAGISVVGAVTFVMGMQGAADAIVHAAPADRATLMAGSVGEAINTAAFGFACAAALLGALALGTLFGVVAQTGTARRLVGLAGLVFLALGGASLASLLRVNSMTGLFRALAEVVPADRSRILATASEEAGMNTGLLVAVALLLVVVAAGAVALKDTPRLALLLPVLGLGGLMGQGAYSFSLARAAALTEGVAPARRGLISFTAPSTGFPDRCLDPTGIVSCDDRTPQALEHLGDELVALTTYRKDLGRPSTTVALGVFPGAPADAFWTFVHHARLARFTRVELVGEQDMPALKLKAEFAIIAPLIRRYETGVEVGLATLDDCGPGCVTGSIEGGALVVKGERWTPGPPNPGAAEQEVHLPVDPTLPPEQLVPLALAAAARGHRLVLAFAPTPRTLDDEPGATLSKKAIAAVVSAKNDAIRRCYERALVKEGPGLAGKVVLRWTISSRGEVEDLHVESATLPSEAVKACLLKEVEQLQFPAPADGREVEISYPWVFTPAE